MTSAQSLPVGHVALVSPTALFGSNAKIPRSSVTVALPTVAMLKETWPNPMVLQYVPVDGLVIVDVPAMAVIVIAWLVNGVDPRVPDAVPLNVYVMGPARADASVPRAIANTDASRRTYRCRGVRIKLSLGTIA